MFTIEDVTFDNLGTPDAYNIVSSLINAVLIRHYSYLSYTDREDCFSEAFLKVTLLLKDRTFDPTRSSKKNYLYTGIRNAIQNYLYKGRKEVPVEDTIMATNAAPDNQYSDYEELRESDIRKVFSLYNGRYDFLEPTVRNRLYDMGFIIKHDKSTEDVQHTMVERLVCLTIWKHQR